MKKLAAIFLFTLFLFNIIGYRIAFYYAQKQSDLKLEASLDKNLYNESELVTIKIPLSLPYQNDQTTFERVDGEVNFNGKIYKYVKRKISEGNLILLCLPDYNKMRLAKEKDNFFKDANNLTRNVSSKKQENSKGNSLKNLISEYDELHTNYLFTLYIDHICHYFSTQEPKFTSAPHASPEQPPELVELSLF